MHAHRQHLLSRLASPIHSLQAAQALHALLIKSRLSDPFHATRILRYYADYGDLLGARNLFDESPQRSVYLWNAVIRAHARAGRLHDAHTLFSLVLRSAKPSPDGRTFACLARACAERRDARAFRAVHAKSVALGFGLDSVCISTVIRCYSKLGLVTEASRAFCMVDEPDLVQWNAMILAYGSVGDWGKGIELVNAMQAVGIRPDGYTVVGVVSALGDHGCGSAHLGEMIHGFCVKCGWDLHDHAGSALVGMYSRCGDVGSAARVFDSLSWPDLVSWSALIAGFSRAGDHVKALAVFREFVGSGGRPDCVLIASIVAACARVAIVQFGCEIHGHAVRHGRDKEVSVSSALVDMYAKCGFLEMGIKVFKGMQHRNVVSYNAMISGLGVHGRAFEAFELFNTILLDGLEPDESTFVGLLSACCHSGLVNEGREVFRRMTSEFSIEAKTEHLVYMVKLLGMDGKLREAYELIQSLQRPVDSSVWGALLSCCDSHKNNHEMVNMIHRHLVENDAMDCGYGVMLSNIFANDGRWDEMKLLRVDTGGAKGKLPGISWISD